MVDWRRKDALYPFIGADRINQVDRIPANNVVRLSGPPYAQPRRASGSAVCCTVGAMTWMISEQHGSVGQLGHEAISMSSSARLA